MRVLNRLKIEDCFDGIIDIYALAPYCKPQAEAYQYALEIVGGANPKTCVFLDDSLNNLEAAHKVGFYTILVGKNGNYAHVNLALEDLLDLPQAAPELWR